MAIRTISDAGGNWNDVAAWVEGAVPVNGDDIRATATSGNLAINVTTANLRSIDLTGYTGLLSGSGRIAVVGPNSETVDCKLVSSSPATLGGLRITPGLTGTVNLYAPDITFGGDVVLNYANQNATTINLLSDLNVSISYNLTINLGTLNTNNYNIYAKTIQSTSGTRVFNFGTSTLTAITSMTFSNGAYVTWNCADATFVTNNFYGGLNGVYGSLLSYAGTLNTTHIVNGEGPITFKNIILEGIASSHKSIGLSLGCNLTVTDLFKVIGYNATTHILVMSNVLGTQRILTCNGIINVDKTDFQDIVGAGSANWDLSGVRSGDCGGNSGITFTPAITKYWTGSTMNWSNLAAWTDNIIPLPQDSVILPDPGGTGRTLTADMPRLCKNITVTNNNATNEFTVYFGMAVNFYGSITLTPHVNITQISPWTADWTLSGRSYHSIDMAGKSVPRRLIIAAPGGTYTAQSAVSIPVSLLFVNGNYNNGGYTTTASTGVGASTGTSKILSGAGSYVCRSLDMWAADLTWSYPSDLYLTGGIDTVNNMPGLTVGNIIVSLDTKTTTFKGAFTFANMTMASAGAKTIKFTKATTYTMTGDNFLSGTANNLITIDTNDGTGTWTLNKTAGTIATDYISLKNSTATGGATFYAGSHSVNVSGNTGWLFQDAPPLGTPAWLNQLNKSVMGSPFAGVIR